MLKSFDELKIDISTVFQSFNYLPGGISFYE
jgi:hypothetical protein